MSENLTLNEKSLADKVTLSLKQCLVLYGFIGVLELIAELSQNVAYSHPILEAVEKIKKLDHD